MRGHGSPSFLWKEVPRKGGGWLTQRNKKDGMGKRYSHIASFPTQERLWCGDTALPPSYGRRCLVRAEVGSRSGIKRNG